MNIAGGGMNVERHHFLKLHGPVEDEDLIAEFVGLRQRFLNTS
jgi:hypothetical protein